MPSLQIILYQDKGANFSSLKNSLRGLSGNGWKIDILLSSAVLQGVSIDQEAIPASFPDCQLSIKENGESFFAAINRLLKKNNEGYYLLLSSDAVITKESIAALMGALEENPQYCGASPILLSPDGAHINSAGYVLDSGLYLHHLYGGWPAINKLIGKKRVFSLTHIAAFMGRLEDFKKLGGFQPQTGLLCFFNFCLQLLSFGAGFVSPATTVANYENREYDLEICGLWNSLVRWGKLKAGKLEPDYYRYVLEDGFEYGLTSQWLQEGPIAPEKDFYCDAWQEWRNTGDPVALLKYLNGVEPELCGIIINLIRKYPCFLPAQMRFYEIRKESQKFFAARKNLKKMATQLREWRKLGFHYGILRPGMALLKDSGIYNVSLDRCPAVYDAWLELAKCSDNLLAASLKESPKISVLMPVYNPDPEFFRQAVDSVLRQTHKNWELCIVDDASPNGETKNLLQEYKDRDERIKIIFRGENGHISRASNTALDATTADWAAFMDQDDMLDKDALAYVAKAISNHPGAALIYTDEDHIDVNNLRRTPFFKPDWDPVVKISGHLSVYSVKALRDAGGLRPGFEGSQDFDLLLRIMEIAPHGGIIHIPNILYHWRVHDGSTAGSLQSKPYVLEATKKCLVEAAIRKNQLAEVHMAEKNNFFRLLFTEKREEKCAIIIFDNGYKPSRQFYGALNDVKRHFPCSLHRIFPGGSQEIEWEFESGQVVNHILAGKKTAILSQLARELKEDIFLSLDASLEPLPGCHLEQLPLYVLNENATAVGSLLWYGAQLYHGGLYPDITGLPFALLEGARQENLPGYCWGEYMLNREVAGINWDCAAFKRKSLLAGDYLAYDSPILSQAAYALEQRLAGSRAMVTPWSQWRYVELPDMRQPSEEEKCEFLEKWGSNMRQWGLRNPNLYCAPDNDWSPVFGRK